MVGGGDTAMEDATFLAKFADRVGSCTGGRSSAPRRSCSTARQTDNIDLVTPYVVKSFDAGDDGALEQVTLENTQDGSERELPVTGAFVAIGHRPNSQLVEGQIDLDDEGYVLVDGRSTRASGPACSRPAT